MSITIKKDINRKHCYIGLDSERFDDILQSLGVSPINKNSWIIDESDFTLYDASIPFNIGQTNYQIIYNEVLSKYYDYIEFHRED